MAYYTGNHAQSQSMLSGLLARLTELRASAAASYGSWRVYRSTLTELEALSPRELADLGIAPTMVKQIAREAAYGKKR